MEENIWEMVKYGLGNQIYFIENIIFIQNIFKNSDLIHSENCKVERGQEKACMEIFNQSEFICELPRVMSEIQSMPSNRRLFLNERYAKTKSQFLFDS